MYYVNEVSKMIKYYNVFKYISWWLNSNYLFLKSWSEHDVFAIVYNSLKVASVGA